MIEFIKSAADDKSWRMRYVLAEKIVELAKSLGTENLLPIFVKFLQDSEGEVKIVAASRASEFCKLLDSQSIITNVLPHLSTLSSDSLVHVRRTFAFTE